MNSLSNTSINETQYKNISVIIEDLLDQVGGNENHPLAGMLDYYADRVREYEEKNVILPEAKPLEMLRFLMEQHALKQEDMLDCAPQSRIFEILAGKRGISKTIAKKLARKFNVHADLLL